MMLADGTVCDRPIAIAVRLVGKVNQSFKSVDVCYRPAADLPGGSESHQRYVSNLTQLWQIGEKIPSADTPMSIDAECPYSTCGYKLRIRQARGKPRQGWNQQVRSIDSETQVDFGPPLNRLAVARSSA